MGVGELISVSCSVLHSQDGAELPCFEEFDVVSCIWQNSFHSELLKLLNCVKARCYPCCYLHTYTW